MFKIPVLTLNTTKDKIGGLKVGGCGDSSTSLVPVRNFKWIICTVLRNSFHSFLFRLAHLCARHFYNLGNSKHAATVVEDFEDQKHASMQVFMSWK